MAFSYWAREAALTLDWNEVYADFKDKNCTATKPNDRDHTLS